MSALLTIWRAGRTRRWHVNHRLSETHDYLDGHHARVARMILALHKSPSMALIRAALTHDDGESVTGDIPAPFKASLASPILAGLESWERDVRIRMWGGDPEPDLTKTDQLWIKLMDRLDAYLWAGHHGQDMTKDGWNETRSDIVYMALCVERVSGLPKNFVYGAIGEAMEAVE